MTAEEKTLPTNIKEFNEIVGVIFGQLYETHPLPQGISCDMVARALAILPSGKLPSGRSFESVFHHTLEWLAQNDFVEQSLTMNLRGTLRAKALAIMNAFQPDLRSSLGSELVDAAKYGTLESGKNKLAELIGHFFGSFTASVFKSMSG